MGKPTITKYADDEYVEGTTLIVNDANIMAEIAGNIESKVNVKNYHNVFTINFHWQKGYETYTYGNDAVVAAIKLPSLFTLMEVQFIGFASEAGAGYQFADSPVNAGSDNKVAGLIKVFDFNGDQEPIEFGGATVKTVSTVVTEAAKVYRIGDLNSSPINREISVDSTLVVGCRIDSSANANFTPIMQVTLYCKQEHGR